MKTNKFLAVFFLLTGIATQAQLYVASNSYVYVGNQYLFVKGDVNLNASTSNVYLRNDGQLLQGTTAVNGSNTGLGALSVYQEGTVNNYQYNYWCSPVGGSLATSGNSPFGVTQLGIPTTITGTSTATILPFGNYDGVSAAGALSIAPYWIWKYTTATLYSQWAQVASASTINAGEGFTMKGTSGSDATVPYSGAGANNTGSAQRYDFRGKPNDGTINVPVTTGTQTLTGNPYPSAIDMQTFLTDPANALLCDGTALYWEHDKTVNSHLIASYRGGYGVYNGVTDVYTPATFYTYTSSGAQGPVASTPLNSYQRKFAPIGQGFMIRGIASGNVQLKNTHRVYRKEGSVNNSQFERNANVETNFYEDIPNLAGIDYTQVSKLSTPHIKINVGLNAQAVRQIALVFTPDAVAGYDRADSKSPDVDANLPADMYLYLNNTEYVQSANKFDIQNKYPIGFKNAANATYKIQVADMVNFTDVSNVYLHDKDLDTYLDIKNTEVSLTMPAGVNNTRYEITFETNALNTEDSAFGDFTVFQNNSGNMLTIKNPTHQDISSCTLFDMAGKTIFTKKDLGSNDTFEFATTNLSQGIYIVKLNTKNNKEISKKVSISNWK